MSAFLVSERTLYNCMGAINFCEYSKLYKDMKQPGKLKIIFMALNSLNSLALKVRYGDEPTPGYKFCHKKLYDMASTSKIQALKSLNCLIYQCTEGEVVKTGLYKKLVEVKNDLMDLIISDMPEYDQAVWDAWPADLN